MFPKGIIYQSGKSKISGEKIISLPLGTKILYHVLSKSGAAITAFMILSFLWAYLPAVKEEVSYELGLTKTAKIPQVSTVDLAEADKVIAVQKEAETWKVNSYFSVVIPKIGASSNILANVNAANRTEYVEALQRGVAHAKGTYFPGQGKTIFLFSHSTDSPLNIARFNAVFYLLRKLEPGDNIIVYFADQKYEYSVSEKQFAEPDDTSWLSYDTGSEKLVLMTCDPPGTTWRRLLIIAEPL